MQKIQTLLVTKAEHIRYLTGTACAGVVLFDTKRGRSTLMTDARYFERAKYEVTRGVKVVLRTDADTLPKLLCEQRITKLGVEADDLTLARFDAYKKRLKRVTLVPTTGVIETRRTVKKPAEIATIRKACELTARILKATLPTMKRGVTELAVAETIRQFAAKFGVTELAFDTIVAFGENAAIPHAVPGKRKLRKGDVVLFDMGVKIDGYCADMSRTFFTAEPRKFERTAYEAVLTAQLAGVANVRAGAKCADIDAVVRQTLHEKDATFAEHFTHSTGHGVGLEIHEWPNLGPQSKDTLSAGNVVTVEPGVYFPGDFGIRIEDTVVVGKTRADVLTPFPKKLTVLRV